MQGGLCGSLDSTTLYCKTKSQLRLIQSRSTAEEQAHKCTLLRHFGHSRMIHDTEKAISKAAVGDNTYFGTLSLLEEAAADVACDRYASVRERALISLAALAEKKVPVTECYTQPGLYASRQVLTVVVSSLTACSQEAAEAAYEPHIQGNSFMQKAARQGYSSQGGMSSYLQVGSFLVLRSLFGA